MKRNKHDDELENVRQIARCCECEEDIFDDSSEVYIDADGNYFCSLECALNFYGIRKSEDCWYDE
jgi:hypothetical protein